MIKGEPYHFSKQKRAFDLAVAATLFPVENTVRRTVAPSFFHQERIGQNGVPFIIFKFQTLDDDGEILSSDAATMRRYGLDELPQYKNIVAGDMSAVGHRPLVERDLRLQYETVGHDTNGAKLVDEHQRIVMNTKPGCLSTYVLRAHRGEVDTSDTDTAAYRMETEIADAKDASLAFDMSLLREMVKSVALRKMERTSTAILYDDKESA